MDVGVVANEVKRVQFEIAGQTGWVDYRPNYYTLRFNTELERLHRAAGDLSRLAPLLTSLFADWDLENGGVKIPVTEEGIASLPLVLLNTIDGAIMADMEIPSEDEKKGSSAPTSEPPTGSSEDSTISPNGSDGSVLPAPQPASSVSPSLT